MLSRIYLWHQKYLSWISNPNLFLEFKSNHFKSSSLLFWKLQKLSQKYKIYFGLLSRPYTPSIHAWPNRPLARWAAQHGTQRPLPLAWKLQAPAARRSLLNSFSTTSLRYTGAREPMAYIKTSRRTLPATHRAPCWAYIEPKPFYFENGIFRIRIRDILN